MILKNRDRAMTEIPTEEAAILAIDLDGTVCTINSDYSQCEPLPGSLDALKTLQARGFSIYLHTGRHINNARVTQAWLDRFEVPHDLVVFGKPPARIYLDDRGMRFTNWDDVLEQLPRRP